MVAAAFAASAVAAGAATNEAAVLPPVVVYGSRVEDVAENLATRVQVFDARAIADSGARDLPELLDKKANLQIRTLNANPLQAQVAMRGFGENSFGRVKILVDGEEINQADMEAPNLARIPLGGVTRVEVIHGPSPVLYGDGAVAGVINVLTDADDYAKRTRIAARGGSYGTFGANFQTKGGFKEEGLLYSAVYDYVRSDGYRARTGYDVHSAAAGLRKNFANGSTLGLKTTYADAFYEMPGSLTRSQWKRDPRQALSRRDWCRVWNYGLSLDAKMRLAEDQWLYLDGAFSSKTRKANWGAYGYANEYDLYGWQLSPRYVNEKDVGGFGNKFTAGADFKFDRYEVRDRSRLNNPRYTFNRARYALFAQDEFFLTDELSVLAGARAECIDNRWAGYRGLAESSAADVMGDYELGLVYRPVEGLKTYVKGTRFHRSAFCDELNYTADGRFLEPETGTSLDLGFEYAFAREFTLDAAGYWTVMDDEIFYNPYARDYGAYWGGYNCNSPGRTERLGFDAGFGWRRDQVAEASIRYAFVDARFRDGQYAHEDVPLVPQNRVRLEAGVWLVEGLEVKGGCRYVSSQVLAGDFPNAQDRLGGYVLFDVGVHYEPTWAEGWKASFVMDNLFDRRYCDFAGWSSYSGAYYYPACGRSFMFTVAYTF